MPIAALDFVVSYFNRFDVDGDDEIGDIAGVGEGEFSPIENEVLWQLR